MMSEKSINVLYVDDEKDNLRAFTATFRRSFNVITALSSSDAELALANQDIHILITDQRMPVKTGTELLAHAVKKYPDKIRILLTAYADITCLEDAINIGHIYKYFKKPWHEEELRAAIEEGYKLFCLQKERDKLVKELENRTFEVNKILNQK
ncbi:MAG: response regulator [Bacteroidota bacterium]